MSYAIGVAQPLSVHVDTYGTGNIPDKQILQAVLKNFDFRPGELAGPLPNTHTAHARLFSWASFLAHLLLPMHLSLQQPTALYSGLGTLRSRRYCLGKPCVPGWINAVSCFFDNA